MGHTKCCCRGYGWEVRPVEVGLGWRPALHVCWVPELSHTITTPRCGVGRGGSTGFWFNLRHGLDYIGDRDREPGLMGRQIERQQRKVVPLLTTLLTPYGGFFPRQQPSLQVWTSTVLSLHSVLKLTTGVSVRLQRSQGSVPQTHPHF